VIGFRFRPAAAAGWLGIPARELLNGRVALEDLWGRRARELAAGIGDAGDDRTVIHGLEAALARQAPARSTPHTEMAAVFRLIADGARDGLPLMPWLTAELGVSERTLRRRCEEAFGYGPKTLERVLRFQRFLQRLRAEPPLSAAGLAVETGYADQPHLVRETRRLAAATPRRLAELLGVG
jgi:AraC-like DNA-binding protein